MVAPTPARILAREFFNSCETMARNSPRRSAARSSAGVCGLDFDCFAPPTARRAGAARGELCACWLPTATGILCPPNVGKQLVSSPVVLLSVGGVHLAEQALCEARPRTVRAFFTLANQHMRWELNDLARRLDERPTLVELHDEKVPAPSSSDSLLTLNGRRMLQAG